MFRSAGAEAVIVVSAVSEWASVRSGGSVAPGKSSGCVEVGTGSVSALEFSGGCSAYA